MNKRPKVNESHLPSNSYNNLFITYYFTIFLFIIGLVISDARVWGFNWWAYQPTIIQIILILAAISICPILWVWSKQFSNNPENESSSSGKYWFIVAFSSIGFTSLFYIFSSTTHFLGDGYYLLIRLAQDASALKYWDIGASILNKFVSDTLGEPSEKNALMTFRLISAGSGFLMLILVSFFSYKLFDTLTNRLLFFFGIISSGFMLHFFGYVENYALFIVMIITFTLLGLLAVLGKINRWLAVIPMFIACGLHIFGLTLLATLLYILFFDKKLIMKIENRIRNNKLIILFVISIISLSIYFFMIYKFYFFKFAFLPLIPDRFTVDNDYLLSLKHMGDFINLLILLVPGIGIFVIDALNKNRKRLWSGPVGNLFILLLASTMSCIYLFNPGHGMPRNWDLFSLIGMPLSVFVFYNLLSGQQPSRRRFFSVTLVISLGFLILIPRVSSQWIPEVAIKHFKNYVELDRTRNRNARSLLTDYYKSKGNTIEADRWHKLAVDGFPEAGLTNRGKQLLQSGNYDQAEALFLKALQINPIFVDAYSNLGTCYMNKGDLKKALEYLELGDGLNPLNPSIINNKGIVFLRLENYKKAEFQFLEVLRIDPNHLNAMSGLVSVNVKRLDDNQTLLYLERIRITSGMPVEYFQQGAKVCIEAGLIQSAKRAYQFAVEFGADQEWQLEISTKYPELLN